MMVEYYAFRYNRSLWKWGGETCACCRDDPIEVVRYKHRNDSGEVVRIVEGPFEVKSEIGETREYKCRAG